jgi:hypothetical protein
MCLKATHAIVSIEEVSCITITSESSIMNNFLQTAEAMTGRLASWSTPFSCYFFFFFFSSSSSSLLLLPSLVPLLLLLLLRLILLLLLLFSSFLFLLFSIY